MSKFKHYSSGVQALRYTVQQANLKDIEIADRNNT